MKVALLSRISTSDQSNESALEELKRVALNKGYDIYDVYEEVVSGAKGIEEREQLQKLLSDAKQGCFGAVYVWELSRLSRNLRNLINIIEELDDIGVTLYSLREGVSTDTHSGKMFISLLGIMSQWELSVRADRVARGIEHYRKTHKTWGRKKEISKDQENKVVQLRTEGLSIRNVSKEVGISTASVQRILKTA